MPLSVETGPIVTGEIDRKSDDPDLFPPMKGIEDLMRAVGEKPRPVRDLRRLVYEYRRRFELDTIQP